MFHRRIQRRFVEVNQPPETRLKFKNVHSSMALHSYCNVNEQGTNTTMSILLEARNTEHGKVSTSGWRGIILPQLCVELKALHSADVILTRSSHATFCCTLTSESMVFPTRPFLIDLTLCGSDDGQPAVWVTLYPVVNIHHQTQICSMIKWKTCDTINIPSL
jgi:hypothetical protein